ncbi:MAG: hypothetical protein ACTSPI_16605 [Candidatus Heimdallarchaeaceae archaeon]
MVKWLLISLGVFWGGILLGLPEDGLINVVSVWGMIIFAILTTINFNKLK